MVQILDSRFIVKILGTGQLSGFRECRRVSRLRQITTGSISNTRTHLISQSNLSLLSRKLVLPFGVSCCRRSYSPEAGVTLAEMLIVPTVVTSA